MSWCGGGGGGGMYVCMKEERCNAMRCECRTERTYIRRRAIGGGIRLGRGRQVAWWVEARRPYLIRHALEVRLDWIGSNDG